MTTTTTTTHPAAKILADYADYQAAGQRAGSREARRAFADDVRLTAHFAHGSPSAQAHIRTAVLCALRTVGDDDSPATEQACNAFAFGFYMAYQDGLIARTQAATAAGEVEEELPPWLAAYAQALEAKEAKERAAVAASAQAGEMARLRVARDHAQAWLADLERRITALEEMPAPAPTAAPVASAPVAMPAPAPVGMSAPAAAPVLI